MPTSDLTQVEFRQEYLAAGSVIFSGSSVTDNVAPFFESISLEPLPPHAEQARVYVLPIASPGVDGFIVYGGNYNPAINRIEILENANQNLTTIEKNLVSNNISVNVSPNIGGEDLFEINVTPIAQAGIQHFDIRIPYVEQDIVNNSLPTTIPFIQIQDDASSNDDIFGIVDKTNNVFIINAASHQVTETVLAVNDISSGRLFSSKLAEITATTLDISYDEDLTDQNLMSVDRTDNLPSFLDDFGQLVHVNFNYNGTLSSVGNGSITVDIDKKIATKSGSILTDTTNIIRVDTAYGINIGITITGKTTLTCTFSVNGTGVDTNIAMPCIVFRNNHAFGDPLFVEVTPSTIVLSSTTDAIGSLDSVTVNISPIGKIPDVVNAINVGFSQVPEWSGWFQAQVFEKQSSSSLIKIHSTLAGPSIIPQDFWKHAEFGTWGSTGLGIIHAPSSLLANAYEIPAGQTIPFSISEGPTSRLSHIFWQPEFGAGASIGNLTISDISSVTLQDVLDFIILHLNPYPVYARLEGGNVSRVNVPSEWLNIPAASLKNGTYTWTNYAGNIGFLETSTNIVAAGDSYQTFQTVTSLASLNTLQDVEDAMNVAFALETLPDVEAIAGPSFETYPASLLDKNRNKNIDSMLDTPSFLEFRAIAGDVFSIAESFTLASVGTINDLINDINSTLTGFSEGELLIASRGTELATTLEIGGPFDIDVAPNSDAKFDGTYTMPVAKTYDFISYPTLPDLVNQINFDWTSGFGLTATIRSETSGKSDAITSNLNAVSGANLRLNHPSQTTTLFEGEVFDTPTPSSPSENVSLRFNIRFAAGGNPNDVSGIQVALGGYESDGIFFPNSAPNSFFEPGYNTLFPVSFNVIDADIIYLLVRTRKNLNASILTSEIADYAGVASYPNGALAQQLIPWIPTDTKFSSVWTESDLGNPISLQVPAVMEFPGNRSNIIDVRLEDTQESDSISITVFNVPDEINDFAFLAINRSNPLGSMTESRNARVFGLAFDNRGIWDILIGLEAELQAAQDGQFTYLSSKYQRTTLDADEAWDFEFNNIPGLPAEVQNSISLIPVPGYPQVWVLRLERGVKRYLASVRAIAGRNSQQGCSIDIDMLVTGRSSGAQGICRVTVFYNVYCVFDTDLCDAFWNLTEPPEPPSPELIENLFTFSYQSLIDCENLQQVPDGDNTEFNVPVLVNVQNIPTFENGNALLLLKSYYTAEIQGFNFPANDDLSAIQFETCSSVGENIPLVTRLNKAAIYLPGQDEPITSPFQIADILNNEDSYMYVKPTFQFPVSDPQRDCATEEIVIVGIGYQFKNWVAGLREEDFLFGTNLVLSSGVFAAPELDLCYRYYYNKDES